MGNGERGMTAWMRWSEHRRTWEHLDKALVVFAGEIPALGEDEELGGDEGG